MSLTESSNEFSRENIRGPGLVHVRNRLVEAIKDQSAPYSVWVNIEDPSMAYTIVSTYGDALNRRILDSCISDPHTIMEILNTTGISQTTGYRKIVSLIKNNFLLSHHMVRRSGARQVNSYISLFKEIEFHMSKNQELIRVKFQDTLKN